MDQKEGTFEFVEKFSHSFLLKLFYHENLCYLLLFNVF